MKCEINMDFSFIMEIAYLLAQQIIILCKMITNDHLSFIHPTNILDYIHMFEHILSISIFTLKNRDLVGSLCIN